VGATCGSVPDLCGGTLDCGGCPDGQTCGGGGEANVCGAPPATGEPVWSMTVSTAGVDLPAGAGTDADGNRYLLSFTRNEVSTTHTLRLQRLSPAGAVTFTREWDAIGFPYWNRHFRMAVSPDGGVVLAVSADCTSQDVPCLRSIDFGDGEATASALVRIGPDGTVLWRRDLPGWNVQTLAVGPGGQVAWSGSSVREGWWVIETLDRDGGHPASSRGWGPAIAVDAAGGLVVGGWAAVRKHEPGGAFYWERALPGASASIAAAVAGDGTIVVLANRTGDVEFGPSKVQAGSFVAYVLEADGRPRFARGLDSGGALALDPAGRVAVVGTGNCGHITVEVFDLRNADLWRRALPDGVPCWPYVTLGDASYGADHRLFVTGSVSAVTELAGTTFVPRWVDVFGVLLGP
jgi:hypothetical protein